MLNRSMDNHLLNRVNSCIKVRKERTEAFIVKTTVALNNWLSLAMKDLCNASVLANDP